MKQGTILLLSLMFVLASAAVAWADEDWNVANGNYSTTTNWSGGSVPTNEQAYVRNGGVVTLDSAAPTVVSLWLGGTTGGSTAGGTLYVLNGASLTAGTAGGTTGSINVGNPYGGTVYQSGGTISTPAFYMSSSGTTGQQSYYSLSGGGSLIVDNTLAGGTTNTAVYFGGAGGTAKFVQSGTDSYILINNAYNINIGGGTIGAPSLGEFTMTNGSIVQTGGAQLNVGIDSNAQNKFTMSDGTVNAVYKLQVGYGGTGTFNQNGGYVTDGTSGSGECDIGLSHAANGTPNPYGVYNLTAGTLAPLYKVYIGSGYDSTMGTAVGVLNVAGGTFVGNSSQQVIIGYKGGQGSMVVTAGYANLAAKGLYVARDNNSGANNPVGLIDISGGSMDANTIVLGQSGGQGTLVLRGTGTLGIGAGGIQLGGYYNSLGTGLFTMSGGTLIQAATKPISVGYKDGVGTFNFSGGEISVDQIIASDQTSGVTPPKGTINVSGGLLDPNTLYVGRNGPAVMNVTNGTVTTTGIFRVGGGFQSDAADSNAAGQLTISGGTVNVGQNLSVGYVSGKGTVTLNSGLLTVAAKTNIGDANYTASSGQGTFIMTGGSFSAVGTDPVFVGYNGTLGGGPAKGVLSITGGTFRALALRLLNNCDPTTANTAYLKIGVNANVGLTDTSGTGGFRIYNGGTSTVEMEVASATKNSLLNVNGGTVDLGNALATLAVNRTSTSYRPSQGNTFTLISATGGSMAGSFKSTITSNIPGWLRSNIAVAINLSDPSTYRPVFSGAVSGTNYVVTFQGARAGDATGDNKVDGTDLAAVGASWLKTGGTYNWLQGDFNGDGIVDGTDLAALGASWLWTGAWPGPAPADAPLPEPATLVLLSLGGLALIRRRRA
jgi:hypothetical protein